MFIKQIDMKTALELAAEGREIKVLIPAGPEAEWEGMMPDTIQHLLEGVMFFRDEPALEKEIPPPTPQKAGNAGGKRKPKPVDTGKMLALRNAGWSMKKIGEEMGISEGSVFNYLKKLEGESHGEENQATSGTAPGDQDLCVGSDGRGPEGM